MLLWVCACLRQQRIIQRAVADKIQRSASSSSGSGAAVAEAVAAAAVVQLKEMANPWQTIAALPHSIFDGHGERGRFRSSALLLKDEIDIF